MNIGQAAELSGVSAKMIRYYEDTGLVMKATRMASGYRSYGEADVHSLRFIRHARDLGFSISRIKDLLRLWHDRSRASEEVKQIALAHVAELEADIRKLQALKNAVKQLAGKCHGDGHPECPILDELGGAYAGLGNLR